MTSIVLADGKASPANHTFVVVSNLNGVVTWEEQNPDAKTGNRRITASLLPPKGAVKDYKVIWRMWNPTLETLSPSPASSYLAAPKVAYVCSDYVTSNIPERSSLAERKDNRALLANLMDDAVFIDTMNNLAAPTVHA